MSEKQEQFNSDKQEQSSDKKRKYFVQLGLQVRGAFKIHKEAGLWERKEGKRDWGNVSEHCLVEVARAEIFAEKLRLSDNAKSDLNVAAALHDFFKKGEKEIVVANGLTWDSFKEAADESGKRIKEAGFNERIVWLTGSVGHGSLSETEKILNKKALSEDDTAFLVLHYVDDYTLGSDWVKPADAMPDGSKKNDFDKRMDYNESNQRYARLNEEGKTRFNGETTFEAQRRIGHLVEERLSAIVSEKSGQLVDVKDLPEIIDAEIKSKIEAEN